jgi:putative ABC transport system substrate-binding protein
MRRREFITLLGGAAVTWPLGARAQQAKLPRIGVLTRLADARSEAFRQGLRDLRYVEGQNITIEWRFSGDRTEQLSELAAELVGLNVDLIVATSSVPARAALAATKTIPIVFVAVSNPVEFGLVKSLAQPGGNITGLSNTNVELNGKRLEILREVLPGIRRVAVLFNPKNPVSRASLTELEGPARMLGIELASFEAPSAFELGVAAVAALGWRPDAMFVAPDPLFFDQARQLGDFTTKHRLPTMHTNREHAEAGGLIGYGPSLPDMYRRAATYVDKILKGTRPSELPVEQPSKFELIINRKIAKAIGLTMPPTLLARADEVIE